MEVLLWKFVLGMLTIMGTYKNQWTGVTKPSQMHKSQKAKWDMNSIMLGKG